MRRITTETTIDAEPARVWEVLLDFDRYPEWNPFLRVTGEARAGARLTVKLLGPNGRSTTFRPTVQAVEEHRTLRWKGKLWVGGLFDGVHEFVLDDLGGRTRLTHAETFTGLLIPFSGKLLAGTEQGFGAVNAALGARLRGEAAGNDIDGGTPPTGSTGV